MASSSRKLSGRLPPGLDRPAPICGTCAARSGRGARSRSQPRGATTCCSRALRAPARRCSRAGSRASLSRLTLDEALEVTRIHSVAGLLPPGQPLVEEPPFRAPHHTASTAAIVGGGPGPRPGEASLAHRGVLFLDELAEFYRPALEALRQPLEDGTIAISRVNGHAVFPARFVLVGTMNLCPCGARGDPSAECSCSPQRLASYRDKLSRALLDRFDLVVQVPRARATELNGSPGEASPAVRERVVRAAVRLRDPPSLSNSGAELLTRAIDTLPLSGRGRARVARVAGTIAALAGAEAVEAEHVAEALSYRSPTELGG